MFQRCRQHSSFFSVNSWYKNCWSLFSRYLERKCFVLKDATFVRKFMNLAEQWLHHAFKLIVSTKTAKVCLVFGTHVFSIVRCYICLKYLWKLMNTEDKVIIFFDMYHTQQSNFAYPETPLKKIYVHLKFFFFDICLSLNLFLSVT